MLSFGLKPPVNEWGRKIYSITRREKEIKEVNS
jgi:hypothetical protein